MYQFRLLVLVHTISVMCLGALKIVSKTVFSKRQENRLKELQWAKLYPELNIGAYFFVGRVQSLSSHI